MSTIKKLKVLGYWHNEENLNYPDPACFIDKTWLLEEKCKIIQYLNSGYVFVSAAGYSWCRFRCEEKYIGSSEQTDGVFVWPEGYVHYIQKHDVKPPREFINHVLKNKEIDIKKIANQNYRDYHYDFSYWLNQKKLCVGKSFLTPGLNGTLMLGPTQLSDKLNPKQIKFLKRFDFFKKIPLSQLVKNFDFNTKTSLLLDCDYFDIIPYIKEGKELGFNIVFSEVQVE